MTDVKRELKNWYLVSFEHNGEIVDDVKVIFGVPVGRPGEEWCVTSAIQSIDGEYVTTLNSVYKTVGEGKEITLHCSEMRLLHMGFSPSDCITMREMERQGIKIEGYVY